jgi:hypothetical protein
VIFLYDEFGKSILAVCSSFGGVDSFPVCSSVLPILIQSDARFLRSCNPTNVHVTISVIQQVNQYQRTNQSKSSTQVPNPKQPDLTTESSSPNASNKPCPTPHPRRPIRLRTKRNYRPEDHHQLLLSLPVPTIQLSTTVTTTSTSTW